MRRKIFSVWSVLLVLVLSLTVLVPGCEGEGETTGTIDVDATLDGSPWSGSVSYTLTPDSGSPVNGASVPGSHTEDAGDWTCAYVSGGPAGANFVDITPSATQSLTAGGAINFTLNFVTPGPMQVDAYVTFDSWSINGTPIPTPPPGTTVWVTPGTIIDATYKEHVSGNDTGAPVTVHQTSWLTIHNTGAEGSGQGESMWLHCVNGAGAVTTDPPSDVSNQQCTVEGNPVEPCHEIELEVCVPVNLDVEVDLTLNVCTTYTKTINWIGYPSPTDILFDVTIVVPFHTVTLVSWACVEVGEGFEDTNPNNNCCADSPMITIGFLPLL